ncbi:hypothetical protein [Pseudodesulfovibrio indicus]|uniref:hypothetical protein n=1 Tax=Pseudodesulfovibrio indicus TaxID=1716143 RepID=UPI00292D60BC|nr:hypothetical protein [Pseudodesulfovibrio indicus]
MGTNASFQPAALLQEGLTLFEDASNTFNRISGGSSGNAEAQARLLETDAGADAQDIRRRSVKDAAALREDREKDRAARNTRWGGSNLAMSGSKRLVRDAGRIKDRQDEEDTLFEGEMNARSALRDARTRANLLRINGGGSGNRSTLSLGSSIYGRD